MSLAAELKGHIWEAVRCPHANYVVQKAIATMRPRSSQFIIDELLLRGPGSAAHAAKHRFGCRIIERLLEHCLPDQVCGLVEDLIADSVALSLHPFGNYVVQHILEHGTGDQQQHLSVLLAQHAVALGSDTYGSAVTAKALTQGTRESQLALAHSIVVSPGLLTSMARTRHGHVAVRRILQLLAEVPQELALALRQLEAGAASLRSSRYGRFVASALDYPIGTGVGVESTGDSGKRQIVNMPANRLMAGGA